MAKKKKNPPLRRKGVPNADIPYVERLRRNKINNIARHRDEAALLAMKIATVALNDVFGFGYQRLCRFARRQQELTVEWYSDPEYADTKLNQRLEQLGFVIEDGRIYGAVDDDGNAVPTSTLKEGPEHG